MTAMAGELARITRERVQTELTKLICGTYPRRGIELMVDTGLADHVLPEVPAMRLAIDEHMQHKDVYTHSLVVLEQAIERESDGPDLVLRLAALLHDIGKPDTRRKEPDGRVSFHHHEVVGAKMVRRRLRELRYPKAVVDDVAQLVYLHLRFHGYGTGEWTDSAVRRYVTDAGPLLDRLHTLVRSDCTTRNRRRAAALQRSYDSLEQRIAALRRAGGAGRDPPRPGRQRDHAAARPRPGPAGRRGLPAPAGAAHGARPADPRARPRPSCAAGPPRTACRRPAGRRGDPCSPRGRVGLAGRPRDTRCRSASAGRSGAAPGCAPAARAGRAARPRRAATARARPAG